MSLELTQKIREHFPDLKEDLAGALSLKTNLENLRATLEDLKEQGGFVFLVDLSAVDHGPENLERFEVKYLLLNLEDYQRLQVCVFLDQEHKENLPDVTDLWPNALWPSRELWDMFGIAYSGLEKIRPYNPEVFQGHPLLKDFKAAAWEDIFSAHEQYRERPLRESVLADGPKVQWEYRQARPRGSSLLGLKYQEKDKMIYKAHVQIGVSHRGLEKLCESSPYSQMTRWTSKLNSLCSETMNIVWARSVEKLCGLEITEKAQAMRMVDLELERIKSHLNVLHHAAREVCLSDLADLLGSQLEHFYRLSNALSERRLNSEFTCLGGVRHDYPLGWMTSCLEVLKLTQKCMEEVSRQLTRSHQWMERTKSAHIRPHEALEWGLSGPLLRACGVNFDLRKTSPFYFYSDVDFQIPLGINGDSYERFLVRIEEVFQSVSILNQILDHMPVGPVFDSEQVDSLKSYSGELEVPQGEIYAAVESPNGELGVGLVSNANDRPHRLRFRTPSFYSAQSLEAILPNLHWDQAWMTVHSFNLDHGEVDK